MATFELEPRLFPPVSVFTAFPTEGNGQLWLGRRWNKREKSTHRYSVADVNGRINLTVPVGKHASLSTTRLADIPLSEHGRWWHVHRITLESGYGRTPYFEYYFPEMEKFFSRTTVERYPMLWEYILATYRCVAEFLGLEISFGAHLEQGDTTALQGNMIEEEPYWQVRMDRFGFIPGLSVLDLLFNLGPEAAIYIRKMQKR